jgi:hypothetical protein
MGWSAEKVYAKGERRGLGNRMKHLWGKLRPDAKNVATLNKGYYRTKSSRLNADQPTGWVGARRKFSQKGGSAAPVIG